VIAPSISGTDRISAGAEEERSAATFWLLCRAASRLCAFPVSHVVEAMRPTAIDAVAGVPAPMLGLSVIRGVPTPVLDAGWLFGSTTERCERFVVIRVCERTVAFAVEKTVGVRFIDTEESRALPPLMGDAHAMSALKALDHELAFFVETARVVPEDVLQSMPHGDSA
jgi:purine-binding chemotaxis protein CheW